MGQRNRQSDAGLTLLEMLVVLVLIGLLVVVAFDGLSRLFDLRQRLGAWVDLAGDNAITSTWLRDSLAGTVPEYDNGPHPFRGSERVLTGLTISGLRTSPGVPVAYEWRLAPDDQGRGAVLEYRDGTDQRYSVYWRWEGDQGRFTYFAENGKSYPTWPPTGDGMSLSSGTGVPIPQLPVAIQVDFGGPPLGKLTVYSGIVTMRDADKLISPLGTPLQ